MSAVEKFAIFSSERNTLNEMVFRECDGYCTIAGKDGAVTSVKEIRDGAYPARLASATAILCLVDQVSQDSRYVLIERDAGAPFEANKWQFPAGRMGPGELPLETAKRELLEEVRVMVGGRHFPLSEEQMDFSHDIPGSRVHFEDRFGHKQTIQANSFQEGVTTEFFYEIRVPVPSLTSVTLEDNEPFGRTVQLFTRGEVAEKARTGQMTAAAGGIWLRREQVQILHVVGQGAKEPVERLAARATHRQAC